MSLPNFSSQTELFSTAGLSGSLFAPDDRYRLFAQLVYPRLAAQRDALAKLYCADNGRVALEPVLLLGVSLLQFLDGCPDRQALDLLRYHAGWNFALNRQLGDGLFHPTSLVNFRHRLVAHQLSALAFTSILEALEAAGLVARQSRQRLDSTQVMGRVARMSRLDCVRESLRLALRELEDLAPEARPIFWTGLWERYVEGQLDYRAGNEVLTRKLAEAGQDIWQLLEWLRQPAREPWAARPQAQLLKRVFAEQFELRSGSVAPAPPAAAQPLPGPAQTEAPLPALVAELPAAVAEPATVTPTTAPAPGVGGPPAGPADAATAGADAPVQPRDKKRLPSARVHNPHEPEATYASKGEGQGRKEHVGYKVQVAETVCEAVLAPGEPTRNFITSLVTHPAYESDEAGAEKVEQEQAAMGWNKPPVQYVDGAYVSAQKLAQAQAEGRELIGPAQSSPSMVGAFTAEDFQIRVEDRQAICPTGKTNTQCSRLEEKATGKVSFRFEFGHHCHACPLRARCVGKDQRHRTLVVGEHHTLLQARRREQKTDDFKERMKHRNAIEGTQSELVRAHGLRRARSRGLAKARLQNYFIGAACNVKRWLRLEAWKLRQAARAVAAALPPAKVA